MSEILKQACSWQSRLDSPDCTEEDFQAFEEWLAESARHAEVFSRVSAMHTTVAVKGRKDIELQNLVARDGDNEGMLKNSVSERASVAGYRYFVPLAMAASLVIVLIFLAGPGNLADTQAISYHASSDGVETFNLSDGTVVTLDLNSRISVVMDEAERHIDLQYGRVLFNVTHDSARPFSVSTGDTRIVALGTRFQVDQRDERLTVTLDEGSVEVLTNAASGVKSDRLQPGEQLQIAMLDGGSHDRTLVDTSVVISWTRGRHIFRSISLMEAIDEVNRYVQKKIRLGDPELADIRVSGTFIMGDSDLTASAFTAAFDLRAVDTGNEILLFQMLSRD